MDVNNSTRKQNALQKLGRKFVHQKSSSSSSQSEWYRKFKNVAPGSPDSPVQNGPEFLSRSLDPAWIDVEMMGYWLRKCDEEHGGRCKRPLGLDSSRFGRPNLLIDVQRKCLVAANETSRYACLSYVWGGSNTLKATLETLEDLMKERSLETHQHEIPRTIKDAINL
ncbi:hypothetical protein G7Y89_g14951 [Cudoniella acicularis]|uniref:Heterokaryon incompatibility domain-containing protein n=1 Tax=Cudoniella acicularis TaxID=354080 RepID=A0A8H4QW86_9HELO|nr:hypothetical protein G7Y89_g14951 [Cudoniella acicularis]